jgi:hypothetical protein
MYTSGGGRAWMGHDEWEAERERVSYRNRWSLSISRLQRGRGGWRVVTTLLRRSRKHVAFAAREGEGVAALPRHRVAPAFAAREGEGVAVLPCCHVTLAFAAREGEGVAALPRHRVTLASAARERGCRGVATSLRRSRNVSRCSEKGGWSQRRHVGAVASRVWSEGGGASAREKTTPPQSRVWGKVARGTTSGEWVTMTWTGNLA